MSTQNIIPTNQRRITNALFNSNQKTHLYQKFSPCSVMLGCWSNGVAIPGVNRRDLFALSQWRISGLLQIGWNWNWVLRPFFWSFFLLVHQDILLMFLASCDRLFLSIVYFYYVAWIETRAVHSATFLKSSSIIKVVCTCTTCLRAQSHKHYSGFIHNLAYPKVMCFTCTMKHYGNFII